ncbi:hypothetical protein [Prosthecobacter fluviatilis]|uniref:Uncharacterized protein n=1 Tax=Prosthecobacter fluviatilis TaxID=445931 RepID=A0ABW0KWJ3_9BACT
MTPRTPRPKPSAPPSQPLRLWTCLFFVLSAPAVLIMFLGDVLAMPFVSRRHQSAGCWLLFMAARCLAPILVIGVCAVYLFKHLR